MARKITAQDKDTAREQLSGIKPGQKIYCSMLHRSASGMTRYYDVYVVENDDIRRITWSVAVLTGETYNERREALTVGGCGFDGAEEIVQRLHKALFPDINYFEAWREGKALRKQTL